MSQDVFELIQEMKFQNIDRELALQCAPVIMDIKISNLLIIRKKQEMYVKQALAQSGLSYYLLLEKENRITFFIYRKEQVENYIAQENVHKVFVEQEYQSFQFGIILLEFQKRYQAYVNGGDAFPHEMGLLLGYPVEDVLGFIHNNGKNYLYAGYWKVYHNLPLKQRLFQQYENAKESLIQLLSIGMKIEDIIAIYSENDLQYAAI